MSDRSSIPRRGEPLVGGRYRLGSALGEGGMAVVFEAVDVSTGRVVALKRLHRSANRHIQALFESEYYTLASLQHPHVVSVYDYGTHEDAAYYTMELLEGQDTHHRAPLPWREVCECLRQVASTLSVLHARRLLHRDLNPRNIWRTSSGALKLIDFGAVAPFGISGEIVGTPQFVPPEALRAAPSISAPICMAWAHLAIGG
jgi:serine/threonine protein kinase